MNNGKDTSKKTTVEQLLCTVPAVRDTTTCSGVLDVFHHDKTFNLMPIVDEKLKPIGLIARQEITEVFSKPFSSDLMGNKPISAIMDHSPIVVDIDTEIEDVVRIILDAGIQHIVRGFIITRQGRYEGIGNGYDLINEIMTYRQQHLFGLAHFDQLTRLPNRTLFQDRLNQALATASRAHHKVSLLFIDLDGFKPVNDNHGHAVGDLLLKEVAARLTTCIREGDTAARLGGDEFVVVLIESSLERASLVASRILETLRKEYALAEKRVDSLSASIGIAIYPEHGETADSLLHAADTAMYASKRAGKDRFVLHTVLPE